MTKDKKLTPEQEEINEILVETHMSMMNTLGALDMYQCGVRRHIEACESLLRVNMEGPGCASRGEAIGLSRDAFVCTVGKLHELALALKDACDDTQREHGDHVPGETTEPTSTHPNPPQL